MGLWGEAYVASLGIDHYHACKDTFAKSQGGASPTSFLQHMAESMLLKLAPMRTFAYYATSRSSARARSCRVVLEPCQVRRLQCQSPKIPVAVPAVCAISLNPSLQSSSLRQKPRRRMCAWASQRHAVKNTVSRCLIGARILSAGLPVWPRYAERGRRRLWGVLSGVGGARD